MKKYFITLISLVLSVASCDVLNTVPGSDISPNTFFKTETDLMLFSNAFYDLFDDNSSFYEEESDHYVQGGELPSFIQGGKARNVPSSGGGWSWTMLRRINNLLTYVDQCPDKKLVKEYTAIAKFFRTVFYFEKVKRFGDVPWVESPYESTSEELYNGRESREFIFDKMLSDIDNAIEGLSATPNVYRVNKWTALALKAQICLYEGTFRKYHPSNPSVKSDGKWTPKYQTSDQLLTMAAQAAKTIMDEGGFELCKDYVSLFSQPDADKGEMILALRFEESLSRKNNTGAFALVPSQGMPGLTKKFVDSFLMKDGSRFTDITGWETMGFMDEVKDRDPRLGYCTRIPGYTRYNSSKKLAPDYGSTCTGFQIAKFLMDPSLPNVDRVTMSYNDLPLCRLAEIYLIYAEALAELGTLEQTDLDMSVNKIRSRVGMPDLNLATANANPDPYLLDPKYGYTNPVLVANPNKGVILEIRRERSVELAQEGKRIDDLMRWKEGKCLEQAFYGPYFAGEGQYDLSGDNIVNLCLYSGAKPAGLAEGVVARKIGVDVDGVYLSGGTSGYVDPHQKHSHEFNESRDYLYPIPIEERTLNRNLSQNPGWDDGLSF